MNSYGAHTELNFLFVSRVGAHEQYAAMAEPDVRHLHGYRRAV